nr:unnamed protein product [Digitaria exilis]
MKEEEAYLLFGLLLLVLFLFYLEDDVEAMVAHSAGTAGSSGAGKPLRVGREREVEERDASTAGASSTEFASYLVVVVAPSAAPRRGGMHDGPACFVMVLGLIGPADWVIAPFPPRAPPPRTSAGFFAERRLAYTDQRSHAGTPERFQRMHHKWVSRRRAPHPHRRSGHVVLAALGSYGRGAIGSGAARFQDQDTGSQDAAIIRGRRMIADETAPPGTATRRVAAEPKTPRCASDLDRWSRIRRWAPSAPPPPTSPARLLLSHHMAVSRRAHARKHRPPPRGPAELRAGLLQSSSLSSRSRRRNEVVVATSRYGGLKLATSYLLPAGRTRFNYANEFGIWVQAPRVRPAGTRSHDGRIDGLARWFCLADSSIECTHGAGRDGRHGGRILDEIVCSAELCRPAGEATERRLMRRRDETGARRQVEGPPPHIHPPPCFLPPEAPASHHFSFLLRRTSKPPTALACSPDYHRNKQQHPVSPVRRHQGELSPALCATATTVRDNLATAFVALDDPRAGMSVTIELSPDPVSSMSVTIEPSQYSSSFSHESRPHDRTLEAPQSHARGSAAKLEGALTLERRSVTLEAPQPSSRGHLPSSDVPSRSRLRSQARGGTYPRATFRHARGFVAKLEGALTLEWRFRPFEARQARACGSSSKRLHYHLRRFPTAAGQHSPRNPIAGPYLLLSTHHYRCSAPAVDKCSLSNGCHHSKVLHLSHTTPPLSPLFGDLHGTQAAQSPPCPSFFDKQTLPPPLRKATRKCPSRQPTLTFNQDPRHQPHRRRTVRDNLATAFVALDDPRAGMSVTIELSPDPVSSMSVTIEPSQYSSSFSHESRPHDRTLEAPQSHARGSAAKLEGALTLERRSVTLEAPQPSSRGHLPSSDVPSRSRLRSQARGGTYPRATFRHARGFVAKLEGALTLEWRFRPFEARQARACGSSSKRRSAWSKCPVQARKLCPTPQTPTFNFTRFEVQLKFLEKVQKGQGAPRGCQLAPGALCSGRSPAATWPACGGDRVGSAEPWRQLALVLTRLSKPSVPSRRGRRRTAASRRGAPSYGRAPPWPHARSRRAERTAGGRVRSRSPLHHAMIFDAQPRVCALFEIAAPSMATATATHALARSRGRTVPLSRAQALHRALPPLLSLAHLAISTSPRSLGLLLSRAVRTEPSFSEKFALHTPPFPNFPQIANSGHRSTRTSSPYSEPSPRSTEHAIGFLELHWCSRTPRTSANDPELTGVEAAAAAPPPPRRRRNSDHPRPPNRPQTTRGEPRKLFPHFPVPSSPPFGRRNSGESRGPSFIVFVCLGVSAQKFRDSYASHVEGAIPDGNYHLIPADEEEVPEEGAGAGSTNPEANPQFEQEGKPRSMT